MYSIGSQLKPSGRTHTSWSKEVLVFFPPIDLSLSRLSAVCPSTGPLRRCFTTDFSIQDAKLCSLGQTNLPVCRGSAKKVIKSMKEERFKNFHYEDYSYRARLKQCELSWLINKWNTDKRGLYCKYMWAQAQCPMISRWWVWILRSLNSLPIEKWNPGKVGRIIKANWWREWFSNAPGF